MAHTPDPPRAESPADPGDGGDPAGTRVSLGRSPRQPPRVSLSVRLLLYLLVGTGMVMAVFQVAAEAWLRQVSRALEKDGRDLAQTVLERSSRVLDRRIQEAYLTQAQGHAYRLDAAFAEVGRAVSMVAEAASQAYGHPPLASVAALPWTAFGGGDGGPPDLREDPSRGLPVSWAYPVYKPAPNGVADPTEVSRIAQLRDPMALVLRHHPQLRWVYVGMPSGLFVGMPGNGGLEPEFDPRRRPWYRAAVTSPGTLAWAGPYVDVLTRNSTVTCSRTFGAARQRVVGVAAADVSLATLQGWLAGIGSSERAVALVVDRDGRVICRPEATETPTDWRAEIDAPSLAAAGDGALERAVEAMGAGSAGIAEVQYLGEPRVLTYVPLPSVGWRLAVFFPSDRLREIRDESRSMIGQSFDAASRATSQRIDDLRQGFVLAVIAACILMMAVVGAVLTFRLTRPVKGIIEDIDAISSGDLVREIQVASDDEIGQLARAFNGMTGQLRKTRDQLRENNRTLEIKVEERTRELASRNQELNRLYREVEQAYLKLKAAQSQLIHQERMASLGQLVAGIAHEINNPVNFLINSIRPLRSTLAKIRNVLHMYDQAEELGLDECHERVQDIRRYKAEVRFDRVLKDVDSAMELIRNGADRTGQIVQNLRTFSRTEQVEMKLTDVRPALDVTLNLLAHMMKGRIAVHRDYQDCEPIECNPGQVNQVFMNLLSNAAQAIDGVGEVWIELAQDEAWTRVKIRDNGCGIAEENLYRIFEPFFTTKEAPQGTGLGLSISLNIIQKHGGTIEVRSEVGVGTEFTVSLPNRQVRDDEGAEAVVVGIEEPGAAPFETDADSDSLLALAALGDAGGRDGGPRGA